MRINYIFMIFILTLSSCSVPFFELAKYPKEIEKNKCNTPSASILPQNQILNVEWQNCKDAGYYEIYRDTSSDGSFLEKIYSGRNLSFPDTAVNDGKFYFYKLFCYSDTVDYARSECGSGIYSSVYNSITNIDKASAKVLTINTELSSDIYTFDNRLNIKRTCETYYKYEGPPQALTIRVDFNNSSTTRNTAVFMQIINGEKTSVPVKLLSSNYTIVEVDDINLSGPNVTIYFKIWTETIDNILTQDTGKISLLLKNESLVKKNINAEVIANTIKISWLKINDAVKYGLYRRANGGNFTFISDVNNAVSNTVEYIDSDVTADIDYEYYYLINHNSGFIEPSNKSNVVSIKSGLYLIDDSLRATVMQRVSSIELTWNKAPDVDDYALYRYESKVDTSPVRVLTNNLNSYIDNTCQIDKPYFYRVACIKNGREYKQIDYWAFGLCTSIIDFYEPANDQISNLSTQGTTLFDNTSPPVIYSVNDGTGNSINDVDWYKYKGERTTITVTVTLPSDTLYNNDELFFRWYYNGSYYGGMQSIYKGIDNIFVFSSFGGGTGDVDLYFEIGVNVSAGVNKIGKYFVKLEKGF